MAEISFAGASYAGAAGESVLDTLLRHSVPIANSCRAGACQTCLLRAVTGTIPAAAQQGLKSTLMAQGYFLSCICHPETDLTLEAAGGLEIPAVLASLEPLSPTVLRVRLRTSEPLAYSPGQYVALRRFDGLARSYSLASLPEEGLLELHVRRTPQGKMSGWLFEEAKVNEAVTVRGPAGDCFYTPGNPEQPLLLAGTGTGLAPLVGICKDAVRQGHSGPIHVYHGALRPEGLYLQEELLETFDGHSNISFNPVVLDAGGRTGIRTGPIDQVIRAEHPNLKGWRSFVCGDPATVQLLKKKLFLAGIASRDIFGDSFMEAKV